jgi:hypothetical protein
MTSLGSIFQTTESEQCMFGVFVYHSCMTWLHNILKLSVYLISWIRAHLNVYEF